MNVLEDIRFEKSLPRENRAQILEKIAGFVREWEKTPNRNEISASYSPRKVYSETLLPEVWKFKVSDGNRVLFTRGKCVEGIAPEYEDAIILLKFCKHYDQIVQAKRLSKVVTEGTSETTHKRILEAQTEKIDIQAVADKEMMAELVAEEVARNLSYDPEQVRTRVFKHMSIESLIHLEDLQGIFYLNKKQRECVDMDYRPLLLFGSAGSGKTTIGVYKLIDLIKQNPGIRVGYFTYSTKLAQSAQKIYRTVLKNEVEGFRPEDYKEQVDFYPLKEWLKANAKVPSLIGFEQFRKGFYQTVRENLSMHPDYKKVILKVDAYDIWREIRGLIKGFAGENWSPCLAEGVEGILSLEAYLALGRSYSSYTKEEKTVIYEVALKYMAWLRAEGRKDENDLCRQILSGQDQVEGHLASSTRRYDWIVIDEVQDLTELEIYLLHSCVKQEGNFLLSGDYHQTIAPTFFDTKRIMSLLEHQQMRYKEDANKLVLTYNYRNPKRIVDFANKLSNMRGHLFGRDKRNDYSEEIPRSEVEGALLTLCKQPMEKWALLKEAVKKAYVYIVVATEEEKAALEEVLEHQIRIFTLYEVKGLENQYIIGVNLLSHYKAKWETILAHQEQKQPLEESHLYRYLINRLYVTLSRSQETLCFVEDEVEAELIEALFELEMQHENHFDVLTFGLDENSSYEDFFKEAMKYEAAEDYHRAMLQYEKLGRPEAKRRILYCKGKLSEEAGDYQTAGEFYFKGQFKEEALRCYEELILKKRPSDFIGENKQEAQNSDQPDSTLGGTMKESSENTFSEIQSKQDLYLSRYYECLLEVDEARFKKEVLLNAAVNIRDDLLPYLNKKLKKKVEALGLEKLVGQVEEQKEEQSFSALCIEELQDKLLTITMTLEGIQNG